MISTKLLVVLAASIAPICAVDSTITDTTDVTTTVTGDDVTSTLTVNVLAKVFETEYIWTDNGTLTLTVITGTTEMVTMSDAVSTSETETDRTTVLGSPTLDSTSVDPTSGVSSTADLPALSLVSVVTESQGSPVETVLASLESAILSLLKDIDANGYSNSLVIAPAANLTTSIVPVLLESSVEQSTQPVYTNLTIIGPSFNVSSVAPVTSSFVPTVVSYPANSLVPVITASELQPLYQNSLVVSTNLDALITPFALDNNAVYANSLVPVSTGSIDGASSDTIITVAEEIPLGDYGSLYTITTTTTYNGEPAVLHLVVLPTECEC